MSLFSLFSVVFCVSFSTGYWRRVGFWWPGMRAHEGVINPTLTLRYRRPRESLGLTGKARLLIRWKFEKKNKDACVCVCVSVGTLTFCLLDRTIITKQSAVRLLETSETKWQSVKDWEGWLGEAAREKHWQEAKDKEMKRGETKWEGEGRDMQEKVPFDYYQHCLHLHMHSSATQNANAAHSKSN